MSNFRQFPLAKIYYDKDARQRKEIGDLTELKNSIAAIGLINPIVITRDGQLVAGERRYLAHCELGMENILVQFREELTTLEAERLELDENIHRRSLTWQEHVSAVFRYHKLCMEEFGRDWSQDQTAEILGISQTLVSRCVNVAEEILAGNERVVDAPTMSAAINIVDRITARKKDEQAEEVTALAAFLTDDEDETAPSAERKDVSSSKLEQKLDNSSIPILHEDFITWMTSYSGSRFNLIHCDFPYGINADKHDQGSSGQFGGYADSEEVFNDLLGWFTNPSSTDRLLADSCHLIFWFSPKFYCLVKGELEIAGWVVNPTPLIWFRSGNSGVLPDHRRMPRQVTEHAFLASRGDRFLVQAKSNCFPFANTKQWHMSEKPKEMLKHFLSMLVDDTTRLLDPTCGSGNALIVAKQLGAKEVLGVERDEEFYNNAVQNWKENIDDK